MTKRLTPIRGSDIGIVGNVSRDDGGMDSADELNLMREGEGEEMTGRIADTTHDYF